MTPRVPIVSTIIVALVVATMVGLGVWQLQRMRQKDALLGAYTAAGQNLRGEPGYLVIADCRTGAEGPGMAVELGWTKDPGAGRDYRGGLVSGMIAPDRQNRMRLVAATAGPGLEPAAPPSPDTIPNNHLSYAVQWFLFAGIALVIYVLALRWRRRDEKAASNG